jgi:hypothetical protein
VVDVRVREEKAIELFRIEQELAVVCFRKLPLALEEPAVPQESLAVCFDQVLRSGYRIGAAQKMDFHFKSFRMNRSTP